jgi:dTDP-4-amino-4,6-dideoxygalactose transaminase
VLPIRLKSEKLRDQLEAKLTESNIQTRRWYLPLIQHQTILGEIGLFEATPNAESISNELLVIPFFIDLQLNQIKLIESVF